MRVHYYEVYCDGEYLAIVRALNEDDAIEQVWKANKLRLRGPKRLYIAKQVG